MVMITNTVLNDNVSYSIHMEPDLCTGVVNSSERRDLSWRGGWVGITIGS